MCLLDSHLGYVEELIFILSHNVSISTMAKEECLTPQIRF